MKQYIVNAGFLLVIACFCVVLCKVNPDAVKPQKQAGAVTLDELYTVVTKDGKTYNDAKININHIGCFIINDKGYIYIPIENIKRITEVKYGSTDSTGIRGDVQRLPENR